jgi:hypothetical protein
MSKEDHSPALECAQNIALLSLFSEIPGGPCVNRQNVFADTSGRVLSFKRELRLSDSIALIAGVSDDKNHIVASCVEELPERGGIRILVAINKVQHSSADDVLLRIKHGFEKIFSLVSEFRDGEDHCISLNYRQLTRPFLKMTIRSKERFSTLLLRCVDSASSLALDLWAEGLSQARCNKP